MMNLVALSLVLTSLLAAQVWSPSPTTAKQSNKNEEDIIVKEGHRVVVVETYDDEGGQHNTKVSISPPQDPISTTSAGIVENTREKIKQAAHVLPNLGQGLSGSGSYEESKYTGPRELFCDAFGKCTHKFARAIEKAKEKVSEKAHEAIAQHKEIAHEAKEKAEDAYEIAKETASQKAHEAKEVIEDEYEKAKDFATHKVQNVKETAKESIGKAQDAVKSTKDIGKTIGVDVVRNVSKQVEKAKEKIEEVKNRVLWFMGSPEFNSLMGVISLLGFSVAYGMCAWVTFISSQILANALTRQQFGVVQSKIYPLYFRAMCYCIGLALLGHLIGKRKLLFRSKAEMFLVYNLIGSILVVLINALYLEPLATKVMFEKVKLEKEEGRRRESLAAESSREEPPVTDNPATTTTTTTTTTITGAEAPRKVPENPEQREMKSRMVKMNERLKRLNSYSSFLNILTLMALTWHLVYLSQCLHGTCYC